MRLLILVNEGPNFPQFFWRLGCALRERGHVVYYAIDSMLATTEEPAFRSEPNVRVFSEVFAKTDAGDEAIEQYDNENIWEYFFPDYDRFLDHGINLDKSLSWYLRLASALTVFFSEVIKENAIEAIIYESITNSFAAFAYRAAERLGVRYIGISSSRLPGRFEFHSKQTSIGKSVQAIFRELQAGRENISPDLQVEIDSYLSRFDSVRPDYMLSNGLSMSSPFEKYVKRSKIRRLRQRMDFVRREGASGYPYQMGNPLLFSFSQFKRSLFRYARSVMLSNLYVSPCATDQYYLYPLHFHPEASTSVFARHYVEEETTIKNIAFNLPFGTYLYVKDHVSAFASPSRRFYEALRTIPNVKLMHPNADTKALIRNCIAVVTLTSTVGYEAIVLGKGVFVLGDVFYDFHPLCKKIYSWSDLFRQLRHPPTVEYPEIAARNLVAAYFQCTHPGTLNFEEQGPSKQVVEALCRVLTKPCLMP